MKEKISKTLSALFGMAILGALGYGVFIAIRASLNVLSSLSSDVAVAIIAAAATAFVSVLSIVLGKAYETRSAVRKEHREKKVPVYEDLIRFMFRAIMGTKSGSAPTEAEMLEFMSDFTQRIAVWGSDAVLAAWVKWRRIANQPDGNPAKGMQLMLQYEQLILSIRRDLGHKNKRLARGDVLALFVNDIDEQLKGLDRPAANKAIQRASSGRR